jgi:hypothetical protein
MNLQADGKFELQRREGAYDPSDLFVDGSSLNPGDGIPLSASHQVMSSDYYDGSGSGLTVTGIDTRTKSPSIVATIKSPYAKSSGCSTAQGAGDTSALNSLFYLFPLFVARRVAGKLRRQAN